MPDPQLMQCMEIWGGNLAADQHVTLAGLDCWVYCQPFGGAEGGGDVYYLSACATQRILRLLVADVSGHGREVQATANELRKLMRRYVNQLDHIKFVRSMNKRFSAMASSGLFATAVVSTFFAPTGELTLCNAGHPPPLLYRRALGQWQYLQPAHLKEADAAVSGAKAENSAGRNGATVPVNLPLGITDEVEYQTFDVELEVGDLVLCYTDSLVEARRASGELIGQEGLLAIMQQQDLVRPRSEMLAAVREAIAKESDGALHLDDVTMLLFSPNGQGRGGLRLGRRVEGMKHLLGAVVHRLSGGANEPIPWPDLKLANVGGAIFSPLNHWTHRRKKRKRAEKLREKEEDNESADDGSAGAT